MDNRPIGVFDSGVGGLSVVKEVVRQLPQEDIIYFGDTAHLPYGPKTSQTIKRLVRDNVRFLLKKKVKAIILACHTASAFTLEEIREDNPIPIIGVIGPGAEEALRVTKNRRIGVIGTYGTIRSGAYAKELKRLEPEASVIEKPCPLFVPLVEEGWIEREVTHLVVREYLEPLKEEGIDTLILGCTHYPLLKEEIARVMGGTYLVDSARATVAQMKRILEGKDLLAREGVPRHSFFVSDAPEKFARLGRIFLGKEIEKVEKVNAC
ncbi:MAG TPA: glutamate racemase [bacterium]|nr:glutamate racemase [bacterium]